MRYVNGTRWRHEEVRHGGQMRRGGEFSDAADETTVSAARENFDHDVRSSAGALPGGLLPSELVSDLNQQVLVS